MPKRKQKRKQDPPNALQIEPTEGCSLNCKFCGVQGMRESKGGYKFMTVELAEDIADRLSNSMQEKGWNPRIEFAVHGEPTVNPEIQQIVSVFGKLKPRELIIVTNGSGLIKNTTQKIDALFSAGLTSICLDEYDGCDFAQRIRDNYVGEIPIVEYGKTKFRGSDRLIVVKGDVSHLTKAVDKLNTHCGSGGDPSNITDADLAKRCAKPFREMTIRWDGNVALCCNDFRGVYKIGNVVDFDDLDELWQSEKFEAARKMLYHKNRNFHPCKFCDAISTRVGLLPDKKGKTEMPEPTAKDSKLIEICIEGEPYSSVVLRGWEKKGNVALPDHLDVSGLPRQPID